MEFVPPRRIFSQHPMDARQRQELGSYDIPDFLYVDRSKNGGMLSYFQGHPYPRKGFIYSEGVMVNNKAKRVTLALFAPLADIKRGIIGFLESYLKNYGRMIDMIFADCNRIPFLHYEYYCEFSKAVWQFSFLFLKSLGITFDTAYKTGWILATLFENDDAYKVRVQDILNESVKENFLKNPRKELLRLLEIFKQRETTFKAGDDGAGGRMVKMIKMLSYLLWLPPIKRAFRLAMQEVDFEWFKYDEIDYYWTLNRIDFKTLGREFEDKKEEQIGLMMAFVQKTNPEKKVERINNEDGTINITAYEMV